MEFNTTTSKIQRNGAESNLRIPPVQNLIIPKEPLVVSIDVADRHIERAKNIKQSDKSTSLDGPLIEGLLYTLN